MNKIYKCKIFRINEETGKLFPRFVKFTDQIIEDYNLSEDVSKFMLEELRTYGRYWINDEEIIYVVRE